MRRFVRHLSTISLLFAYVMATFGGSALHSLVHDCSTDKFRVESDHASHGSCSHNHGGQEQHEAPDEPQPNDHDEHSCLICHYVAQAQNEATSTEIVARAEPLSEAPQNSDSQAARLIPQSYDSRGPPAV
jgi:hypothetical protein